MTAQLFNDSGFRKIEFSFNSSNKSGFSSTDAIVKSNGLDKHVCCSVTFSGSAGFSESEDFST